jgi:hypothetical protein
MRAQSYRTFAVLDDRETEVEVEIKVWSWGCAAQTYGPPESCYPAEPPEAEVFAAWSLEDAEPRPNIEPSLTDAERERFLAEFFEQERW